MGDDRPPAYFEGDLLVVRASALGSCMWELIAAAQGHERNAVPEALQAKFDQGHDWEPKVLGRLRELNWKLNDELAQQEGALRVGGNRIVRLHPDAIGEPSLMEGARVIEVKAFAASTYDKAQRHGVQATFHEYEWQLSAMMHAYRLPGVWVVVNKETGELHFQYVDKPIVPLSEIVKRVKAIYEGALGEDIATTERPCEQPAQWPCRYLHLRPEPERKEREALAVPVEHVAAFEAAVVNYDSCRRAEAEAKATKEKARNALRAIAAKFAEDGKPAPALRTESYRVGWVTSNRKRVDHRAMEADGIDVDSYSTETTSESIQVEVFGA